jgi:hypothetical protein
MVGLQAALDSGTELAHPIVVPDDPCPWKRLQGLYTAPFGVASGAAVCAAARSQQPTKAATALPLNYSEK